MAILVFSTVRPGIRLQNKDFWRVALLLSTLLYPSDVVVDCAGDHLNKNVLQTGRVKSII